MDVITSTSFAPAAEVLSQTIEIIIEIVTTGTSVSIEKKSFAQFTAYLDRIIPLLKELNKKNVTNSQGLNNVVDILNREIKVGKQLIMECSKRNKVYLFVNCRSVAKRLQECTREISRALSLIPLASLDISSGLIEDISQLCESMHNAEFKAAIEEEQILEKLESGIQERSVDRSYANNLLISIAEAVGISTERSALKKEFEEFKSEIENVRLKKDEAEAIQMEQIIMLLEKADATSSLKEKEAKYFTKRNSLGSQPLEPLQSFYCPITREVMVDPVETSSGHTFERTAIDKWFAEGNYLCPLTMIPLDTTMLRPNKTLRQSIEEWKDRNTMITIASLKPKLQSVDEEEVLHCLGQLQDLCEQRDLHREWVVLEDYIPVLIELLAAKNRDIRNHALVILCILAKHDDAKERIAEADNAIESIVRFLGRRVGERKLAVTLLLELSKSESLRDCIGNVQGCILLLVTMSSSDDIQAASDAKELLENLSFSNQNIVHMAKANYFKHLLQRLSSGQDDIKMIMASTLAEMELTDHNKSSLLEDGVLGSLLDLLSHDDIEMKKVVVKALQNLSSLPKNGRKMIRDGAAGPLLDLLYRHTSSPLREQVAATIMHLAISTVTRDSNEPQVLLLESDDDIYRLFSLINLTGPTVQQSILRAFHAMCLSPSATIIKTKLAQCSAVQVLVQLCELDNPNIRANAIKLFCCLTEDGDEATILEHVRQKSIETILQIIKTSNDEEEIVSAMGIISNLPEDSQLTQWLLDAGGLQTISNFISNGKNNSPHNKQLIENAVGAVCRFTVPTNLQAQKKAAEAGVILVLVQLLDFGTSLTKRRAAISLAQFSKNSLGLSRPITKHQKFWCFSAAPEMVCPVHRGICTVESSFCLVEAGGVEPLVRVLGEPDPEACEASLDALLTLIEGERLQSGSKVLDEAKAIPSIIKLLSAPSPRLQEKVLSSLERIFRQVEFKYKYGASAHMPLIDLTQRGNTSTKSLAARILAHLNVLHEQSSYF
ncbi:U-box domain-containing protein 44-like [Cornus florida]|uniref:U-box domain-containing protein 44-like n=1 Tax=Cornus florida TaxID=4283 RepID=UPI0028A0C77E|nr:U-box domain-containing protein 44-like [Cornus florida]XP_059651197.1 U-box domain-containing protein 44-like [Cornus florida]XP_059651198.1 U-box domain-containing protein 44-like [Cornus florida]